MALDEVFFITFLKLARDKAGFATWKQLAKSSNLGTATVNRILSENPSLPKTSLNSRNQFAEALGFKDWWTLVSRSGAPDNFDRNVEPYSEVKITAEIPFFDAALAAGHWTDVSEWGVVTDPRQIDLGLFRVRISGDSMTPDYQSGQVIEFRCLRADRDGIIPGRDYYVQRVDGDATFKRVEAVTEDSIILRALNRGKYAEAMHCERALIVRMALAVAVVRVL